MCHGRDGGEKEKGRRREREDDWEIKKIKSIFEVNWKTTGKLAKCRQIAPKERCLHRKCICMKPKDKYTVESDHR